MICEPAALISFTFQNKALLCSKIYCYWILVLSFLLPFQLIFWTDWSLLICLLISISEGWNFIMLKYVVLLLYKCIPINCRGWLLFLSMGWWSDGGHWDRYGGKNWAEILFLCNAPNWSLFRHGRDSHLILLGQA